MKLKLAFLSLLLPALLFAADGDLQIPKVDSGGNLQTVVLPSTAFGRGMFPLADQIAARTYIGAGTSSFDGAFSSLTGKPTTISGYGITDAAPIAATYITQTASSGLSNEQPLSALSTGLLKVTTGTGVLSTGAAGTDYLDPSGSAAALTGVLARALDVGAGTDLVIAPTGSSLDIGINLQTTGSGVVAVTNGLLRVGTQVHTDFLSGYTDPAAGGVDLATFTLIYAGNTSLDWHNRQFIAADGITIAGDWSSGTIAGYLRTDIGAGTTLTITPTSSEADVDIHIAPLGTGAIYLDNTVYIGGTGYLNAAEVRTGVIYDDIFTNTIYMASGQIVDVLGSSIDWAARQLSANDGSTVVLDWSDPSKKVVTCVYKTTTGDPASGDFEGQTEVNTFDNKYKVWAEGAWRQLATW